jgi:chromosome segregation ATPase
VKLELSDLMAAINSARDDLVGRLRSLQASVDAITRREIAMSAELDTLTAAVANATTVEESAITLLNGLSAQIVALKNDPVALQALADSVNSEATKLADAVTANTPQP